MSWDDEDDKSLHTVVVNHEEEYSTWWADREPPPGWQRVGEPRTQKECLAWIDEHWTDQRPLSLRRQMEQEARRQAEESTA
jgi:MbtH protein